MDEEKQERKGIEVIGNASNERQKTLFDLPEVSELEVLLKKASPGLKASKPAKPTAKQQPTITKSLKKHAKKPTYAQNWPLYNAAQTREARHFFATLRELSYFIDSPEQNGKGRRFLPFNDLFFIMGAYTYFRKGSRKLISNVDEFLKQKWSLTRLPHFNTVINHFNRPEYTARLKKLLVLSSLPLKSVEERFAVDASGFAVSIYGRWYDKKYGVDTKKRVWIKGSVISGVETHIITALEVTPGNCHDTLLFEPLVMTTNQNFNIQEISADMAYSSIKNHETAESINAILFCPFKKNVTGKARGSHIWRQMYLYFRDRKDDFMDHYHKRSNSETVFSQIKNNLGARLMTKNLKGEENELLVRAICHNIMMLLYAIYEFQIQIDFGQEQENMIYCVERPTTQQIQK